MKKKLALLLVAILVVSMFAGCTKSDDTAGNFTDGEYEGIGEGYAGNIKVSVKVENGKITKIDLLEIEDTEGIGDEGAKETIENIIKAQSTEVDTVSGATVSSEGTIEAVEVALGLREAKVTEEEDVKEEPEPMTFVDGVYEGSAKGYNGDISLKVTVEGTKITDIEVLEQDETGGIGDVAIEEIIENVIELQSTEVDTVSGATSSSEATLEAIKAALDSKPAEGSSEGLDEQAAAEGYEDGTYEGVGKGFGGDIKVKVEVKDGKIDSVEVVDHGETSGISDPAIEGIPAAIVEANSTDVDSVSGATVSSDGIKAAVKDALK